MISLSILMSAANETLPYHLEAFGIKEENISSYEGHSRFLELQENGALVSTTKGDFTHVLDIFIFDDNMDTIERKLAEMSMRGGVVAIPDENDKDPDIYFL